jgi:3-deoxy-D-manno-octulosonate 8-phosphate phosphatase (KDO 8-P phosphatase)
MSLKETAKKFEAKLKKIKVVAFDLDGILTDGHLWWAGEEVGWNRSFYIYDGYGMKLLMKAGIKVGVITGGDSVSVKKRVDLLKLDFLFQGKEDKRQAFLDIMKKYEVSADEILYMGDEFFDIPLLKKAGFSATVPNTGAEVKEVVDYVTIKESGKGCAREVIDLLRYAQGIEPVVEDF